MSKQEIHPLPDVSRWQVQVLRLTAFPSPAAQFVEPKWWKDLLGTEAETRNTRPARGELTEQGPFDKGTLTLQISPLRIEWNLASNLRLDLDDFPLPALGSFSDVGDRFLKLMATWLSPLTVPPLQRLAFGAVLLQSVDGHDEGYTLLSKYLPAVDLSVNSSDFLYQINRPRSSKVLQMKTHRINRLTKWACVSMQRSIIELHGGMGTSTLGDPRYACSLELDISTSGDFKGELPKEVLEQVFREQYDLGKEIASKGDVP